MHCTHNCEQPGKEASKQSQPIVTKDSAQTRREILQCVQLLICQVAPMGAEHTL